MTEETNEPESLQEETLVYMTAQFSEEEHLRSDSESGGNEDEDIVLITAGFEEDTYGDESVDDCEDDDFYDPGEFSGDDGESGGDSGF